MKVSKTFALNGVRVRVSVEALHEEMPESGLLGRAATSMCRLNCTVGSNPTLFVCPNSSVGRASHL